MKTKTQPIDWTGCPDWIREPLERGEWPIVKVTTAGVLATVVAWDGWDDDGGMAITSGGARVTSNDLSPFPEPDPQDLVEKWVFCGDTLRFRNNIVQILDKVCMEAPLPYICALPFKYIQAADFSTGEPRPVGPIFGPGGKVVKE